MHEVESDVDFQCGVFRPPEYHQLRHGVRQDQHRRQPGRVLDRRHVRRRLPAHAAVGAESGCRRYEKGLELDAKSI